MTKEICSDCEKLKEITFSFKMVANNVLTDVKLCKGCMRNRAQKTKQNR